MSETFNSRGKEIWVKKPEVDVNNLAQRVSSGDLSALSEAITLVESIQEGHQRKAAELLDAIPSNDTAFRVGITGSPGVGKSTLIESLGLNFIQQGKKLAVLTIDPSSSKTKGSILGDKTRMFELSQRKEAFIRPSANSALLGGVKHSTFETILLCEAAGFDVIIIETVGVGQNEVDISNIVDATMVVTIPNSGDEVQTVKKGIMEIADFILINKSDLDADNQLVAQGVSSLLGNSQYNLPVKVLSISALTGKGVSQLTEELLFFFKQYHSLILSARFAKMKVWIIKSIQQKLIQSFWTERNRKGAVSQILSEVEQGSRISFKKLQKLFD